MIYLIQGPENRDVVAKYAALWHACGRPHEEYYQIMRIIAERAFIAAVAPSPSQVAEWKATGLTSRGLFAHIVAMSGKIVTVETAERLWRLFSNRPEPRRARTVADYLRGF